VRPKRQKQQPEDRGAPTLERSQHGYIEKRAVTATDDERGIAGAIGRYIQSPIERYSARGLLTNSQVSAATTLRMDWEFGIAGANGSGRTGNGGGIPGYSAAQLDAARDYQAAVQALGLRVGAVVLPIVIGMADGGEITAGMLAKRRGDSTDQQVMGVLRLGLDILSDHYAKPRRERPQIATAMVGGKLVEIYNESRR
jgi:Domain of unknown function (DUF6456)